MIWHGSGSHLICCVYVWISSFCVCGLAELYWDIGRSSSNNHSDIVVCLVLLLLLTVFAVPARLFWEDIPLFPFVACSMVRFFYFFSTILYLYYYQSQETIVI